MNKKTILIILAVGLLLAGVYIKVDYIGYTETWERQHDVISFGAEEGHAAYIEYILNNHKLPDFDPRTKWGFFQPPLHHIISAKIMEVSASLGKDTKTCQENTQLATCAYMLLLMFYTALMYAKAKGHRLFSQNNLTDGFVAALGIVFLHPMFTILSGSINNDALALILSLTALVIASYWCEKPSTIMTVLLALTIGLAMFAKLTGGLVAVPIAILIFRKVFGFDGGLRAGRGAKVGIIDRLRFFFKKFFLKTVLFAAVVFPVGLYWSIRNKVLWDMPLNYIPPVGENFAESLTIRERFLNLSTNSVYTSMISRGDSYDEFNIPLLILKTSLFSEFSFADVSRWMKPVTLVMFLSAAVLAVIALWATFYVTFSKKSIVSTKWRIILFGTYATYLAAYLGFAITHRNFSAGDFRYAAVCIVCEGIFTGLFADSVKNKSAKALIAALSLVFALSSFATYYILGIKA